MGRGPPAAGHGGEHGGAGLFPRVEPAGYQHKPHVTGGGAGHSESPPQRPEAVGPNCKPDRQPLQPKANQVVAGLTRPWLTLTPDRSEFREIQTPGGVPTQDSRPPHPFWPLNLPTHRHE